MVKKLPCLRRARTNTDDTRGNTVYPDIIVHTRGSPGKCGNLLVIEAKRNAKKLTSKDKDYCKLSAFTDEKLIFRYLWGAHINFVTKAKGPPTAHVMWFENGSPTGVEEDIRTPC